MHSTYCNVYPVCDIITKYVYIYQNIQVLYILCFIYVLPTIKKILLFQTHFERDAWKIYGENLISRENV